MNLYSLSIYIAETSTQLASHRLSTSWQWYVIRAAGFIAAGLIFLLIISGIGQVTGYTYKVLEPVKAWAVHRAMAIALLFVLAVHIGFLLIDHYIKFSLGQVLLPFMSHYSNGTSFMGLAMGGLAVTFGILALYCILIIVISSLTIRENHTYGWKQLHYISYLAVIFIFLHALYTGSDLKYGVFRKVWIVAGFVILIAIISRILRAGTLKKNKSLE